MTAGRREGKRGALWKCVAREAHKRNYCPWFFCASETSFE
jgi:hypothetical protein